MDYFSHHPWPFSYARVSLLDIAAAAASPSIDFSHLPSPEYNYSTTSSCSSPALHLPFFASPNSSASPAQQRFDLQRPCRFSKRVELASSDTSFPCYPDSDSDCQSPLVALTGPSPLTKLASAFAKTDLSLRAFPPEAVADLLVGSQQLEFSRISSPDALRSENTLPSSASRRRSESHLRTVLLLDVRTLVRQSESQIRSAVNISIPNALFKRSSFTIDKIRDTLSSKRARSLLRDWSSYANIIIYDANSVTLNDTGVISYLARKFRQENCTAELGWLYGGYDEFSRKCPELCEPSFPEANSSKHVLLSRLSNLSRDNQLSPPTTADEIDNVQQPQLAKRKPSHRLSTNRLDVSTGPLTCPTSLTLGSAGGGDTTNQFEESLRKEKEGGIARLQTTNVKDKPSEKCCCRLPFVSPVEEKVAIRLPPCITEHKEESDMRSENGGRYMRKPKSVAEDLELPVLNHSNHIEVEMNAHNVPQFLKELAIGRDSEQKLAKIFQTIEKAEQRRLRSLMLHHARYPTTDHPFNISAGVERGEKNRYVNIWPYDYTRVRLGQTPGVRKSGEDSDYVNASFIKAPYCEQTYIATQGPLPTTFNDFWNVVWNKDIKVIVMLTREEEGGKLKCHRYWPDEKDLPLNYGPTVTVELLNKETIPDGDGSIIRRHFRMRYIPTGTTRIIVQFQYIGWPDFGVPDTPLAVLQLRAAVLAGPAIHEKSIVGSQSRQDRESPILVHCSAGCGRTGAFCTIDSTLRLLGRLDGPFGCSNADAIADDVVLARQEAEIEARDHDKAEREDATLPAFSAGNFSVATALNPEPTPDTFRLKMPKFFKGNRRGAAMGQSKDTQTVNNGSAVKSIRETDMRGSPIRNQTATTACSPSEGKLTRQPPNNISHPPLPSAVYTPLPYPNLLPSAESRCTRDVVRGCVEVFREQRLSMVQTLAQFVFCYEAVLWQLMGVPNPAVDNKKVEQADNHVACCGGPVEQKRQPASPAGNQKANLMEAQHLESITPKDDLRVNPLQLEKIRKRKRNELLEGCCPRDDNICSSSSYTFLSKSSSNGPSGKRTLVNEASSVTHPLPYLPCRSSSSYLAYQSPLPENRFPITPGEQGDLKTQTDASFDFKALKGMELPGPSNERGLRGNEDLANHTVDGTESKVTTSTDPLSRAATLWETSRMNHVLKSSKISFSIDPGAKIDGGSASCTDETKADTSTEIDVATLSVTSVSPTFAGSDRSSTNSSPANAVTSRGLALKLESGPASSLERSTLRFGPSLNPLGFPNDDHLQGDVLNVAIRSATEAKEREPTDQNTKENASPIIRSCGRSIKRKEADEYFSIQPVLFPPSHVDVYDPGDGTHFWPAAFPIQNSKAPLPSTAFFALPSTLRDDYGRRRSDPCIAVNTISLLRKSPDEFHRYHTRSYGPRGAMFGPVGLSPTSFSH